MIDRLIPAGPRPDRRPRGLAAPAGAVACALRLSAPLAVAAAVAAFAPAVQARALEYPVVRPDQTSFTVPAYRSDVVEIRLRAPASAAARAARPRDAAGAAPEAVRLTRVGVPDLDAQLAAWPGAWLEPEFHGEVAPSPGSGATDFTAFYLAHLPDGVPLAVALDRLTALPSVASTDPIAILPVAALPNDSLFNVSTWYYRPPSRTDVHAPEAWDVTTGDSSIVIAILDTGVLPYHPDLGGSVAGWSGLIWTNGAEANGVPGVDDDANGYVDDAHGWDFVNAVTSGIPAAEDGKNEDNDPNDYAGHGTAVAGLAAALSNNTIGVAGMNWSARLMPLRVAYAHNVAPLGLVEMSFVAKALRYATLNGAHVINCSFATDGTASVDAAAPAAVQAGVLIVCSAGNDGQPQVLGTRPDVVTVSSCDADDHILTSFPASNLGPHVDLAAPGAQIISTFVAHTASDSIGARQPDYSLGGLTGTSFSAPLVAGAAALAQAHRKAMAQPLYGPVDLILRLIETSDDIAAANPGVTGYGHGRLNAQRLLVDPPGSTVFQPGARTVGAAALLHLTSGALRAVYALSPSRLLFVDGRGTIVAQSATVAPPIGDPAAADLGGGYGIGVFVSVTGGRMDAFDANGVRRAGWPVATNLGFLEIVTDPALGDLDGDGVLEIVAATDDGQVWAWRPNGTRVAGFPAMTDAPSGSLALADLDGVPGAEIVLGSANRKVHVLQGSGTPLAGWPVSTVLNVPSSPLVTRFTPGGEPVVIVPGGNRLRAFRPDGTLRFNVLLPGAVADDAAVGDLDGDGAPEIVVPTSVPATVAVFDSSGAPLGALGWPKSLTLDPTGPPLVGQLRAGDPGTSPEVLIYEGNHLTALTDSAVTLLAFPKPGGAGRKSTLAALDASSSMQVLAGTAPDTFHIAYVYDAGLGSNAGRSPWPTARGNPARNGTTLDPPRRIHDLHVAGVTETTLALAWSAPGDDGPEGRAAQYHVRVGADPAFVTSTSYDITATAPAGAQEVLLATGLTVATPYWIEARAVDADGNGSPPSSVVAASTGVGGPLAGRTGIALAPLARPSRVPVRLYWQGPATPAGRQEIVVFDLAGRRVRVIPLGAGPGGTAAWDGQDDHGRSVPAGLYFARLASGSFHAQTRIVLVP